MIRAILLVLAGLGAALALGLVVVGFLIRDDPVPLPEGEHVIEGTVAPEPSTPSPVGEPFTYAYVEVAARLRQARSWVGRPLLREIRGHRRVTILTADGPREVLFSDPLTQLKNTRIEEEVVEGLGGLPIEKDLPDWHRHAGPGGFSLQVIALRPGDEVLVILEPDGTTVREAWVGGRARWEERQGSAIQKLMPLKVMAWGAGGGVLLFSLALAGLGWLIGR